MIRRVCALFGVIGPLTAHIFIVVSIILSPWFSWLENALSDLGHATRSSVAPFFNFGLVFAGTLIIIYASTVFREYAKLTSILLAVAAFFLQLVAVFDEIYGRLHFIVSVGLFITIVLGCLVYTFERKSILGAVSFLVGFCVWTLCLIRNDQVGIAVPEIVSVMAAESWIILSAIRIYRQHTKS